MAGFGGWGWVPMAPPDAAVAQLALDGGEHVESIHLVTNRAVAPTLGDFLAELLDSELLSDVTICSEDGLAVVRCHKLVLIRWSAPLRRMLTGDMREARARRITLHGVEGDVLAAFLRFLYTCSCSIAPEKLVGLAAMADQYDVPLLQQLCMDAIRTHAANHRCCCLFYKAAKEIQQLEIQQLAWDNLANNLNSLVRQHDVFCQLELEDVLRLCARTGGRQPVAGASAAAGQPAAAGDGAAQQQQQQLEGELPSEEQQDAGSPEQQQQQQQQQASPAASSSGGAPSPPPSVAVGSLLGGWGQRQAPRRPEYALFLALMAWLAHDPARTQHKQQLLACLDLDAMTAAELSQMRSNAHVVHDDSLKELLLDAFARRCLQQAQQPVFHMPPLPHDVWGPPAAPLFTGPPQQQP